MRAARFHAFGPPSVLRVEAAPRPPVKDDAVLIRVYASSINNADIGSRQGSLRIVHTRRLPHVPGYDVAGEVVECGPRVTAFLPGDRVFAMLGLGAGGQAEYASVAQGSVARLPRSIAFADAAATPLAGLTALQALRRKAHIRPGQRVLINGASGGVGSFAVQLAKIVGCHVTGVCRRDTFEFVAGLGADDLIDYRQDSVVDRGERWDVVLDAAGNLDFADVRRVLGPGGVMVAVAGSPRALLMAARTRFASGPRFTLFVTEASGRDLSLLAHLIDQGRLRPTVDRVFPLERIVEAHRYFEEGAPRGKVIVQI